MNNAVSAFLIGLLFGLGLIVSQMVNPAKVLAFLDLFGAWDPSLLLVMGAALLVTALGYRWSWRRNAPWLGGRFQLPTRRDLDGQLIGGALLFGVGWGLAGYCPGPALSAAGLGDPKTLAFVAAMIAGMVGYDLFKRWGLLGGGERNAATGSSPGDTVS